MDSVSAELVEAFARLLPQLSSSASPTSLDELEAIVASPATSLIVARDGEQILGTLTLAVFRIPTGVRAWIEDVVVDEGARGRGVGEALTLRAVELASAAGARSVELDLAADPRGREPALPPAGVRGARDEHPAAHSVGPFPVIHSRRASMIRWKS